MKQPGLKRGILTKLWFLLYFAAAAAALWTLPFLYFQTRDAHLLSGTFTREPYKVSLSPEVEEIYLVTAVNRYFSSETKLSNLESTVVQADLSALLAEQAQHLSGIPFIQDLVIKMITDAHYFGTHQIVYMKQDERKPRLRLNQYTLYPGVPEELIAEDSEPTDSSLIVNFYPDSQTDRLIYLSILPRSSLTPYFTADRKPVTDREMAEAYLQYLGFDVLDDWTENGLGLVSRKAKLQIVSLRDEEALQLYVVPLDFLGDEDSSPIQFEQFETYTYQ
ncbi:hypothetical protein [Anaerolentibacter hominis]|uniref:hypothetical protein n=1 Tax=Anaerolentibacter hominis TaxID=3079009 RepID=UPI0031B816D0